MYCESNAVDFVFQSTPPTQGSDTDTLTYLALI